MPGSCGSWWSWEVFVTTVIPIDGGGACGAYPQAESLDRSAVHNAARRGEQNGAGLVHLAAAGWTAGWTSRTVAGGAVAARRA